MGHIDRDYAHSAVLRASLSQSDKVKAQANTAKCNSASR